MLQVKMGGQWLEFRPLIEAKVQAIGGVRKASKMCGISASTISRIVAHGKEPDIKTFGRLWEWIGMRIEGVRVTGL
jgi:hypothetical protein